MKIAGQPREVGGENPLIKDNVDLPTFGEETKEDGEEPDDREEDKANTSTLIDKVINQIELLDEQDKRE